MNRAIEAAHERYKKAAIALIEATERAFPIGTIVGVSFGRTRIQAEVIGHSGSWWHNPAEVRIRNLATQKSRSFNATSANHEVAVLRKAVAA